MSRKRVQTAYRCVIANMCHVKKSMRAISIRTGAVDARRYDKDPAARILQRRQAVKQTCAKRKVSTICVTLQRTILTIVCRAVRNRVLNFHPWNTVCNGRRDGRRTVVCVCVGWQMTISFCLFPPLPSLYASEGRSHTRGTALLRGITMPCRGMRRESSARAHRVISDADASAMRLRQLMSGARYAPDSSYIADDITPCF